MLDQLIASYRENLGQGKTPSEASLATAEALIQNPDLLPSAFRELATVALPYIGRIERHRLTLKPGKPWFERPECKSYLTIAVPVGRTGRRMVAAQIGKPQMGAIGRPLVRQGQTITALGQAWLRAESKTKTGEKLPAVLPRLSSADQKVIGEYILSFRAAA